MMHTERLGAGVADLGASNVRVAAGTAPVATEEGVVPLSVALRAPGSTIPAQEQPAMVNKQTHQAARHFVESRVLMLGISLSLLPDVQLDSEPAYQRLPISSWMADRLE